MIDVSFQTDPNTSMGNYRTMVELKKNCNFFVCNNFYSGDAFMPKKLNFSLSSIQFPSIWHSTMKREDRRKKVYINLMFFYVLPKKKEEIKNVCVEIEINLEAELHSRSISVLILCE